jgi:hypothetical protein
MHVIILQYASTVAENKILKTTSNHRYRANSKIIFFSLASSTYWFYV